MAAALESAPVASSLTSGPPLKRQPPPPVPIDVPRASQAPNSPERPPVSPITPVASFAQLAKTPALASTAANAVNAIMATPKPHIPHTSSPQHTTSASVPATTSASASLPTPCHSASASISSSTDQQTPRILPPNQQRHPAQPSRVSTTFQAQPAQPPPPEPSYMSHPLPIAVPEEDNADAQALRAALAVLQIQRDKSARDIKTLATLKEAAAKDPEHFVSEMLAGKLGHRTQPDDPLAPTLESDHSSAEDDDDDDDEDDDEDDNHMQTTSDGTPDKLPKFPTRQNIVRCPPVNWAKYHVLGESLDKLHEEQRRRPTLGEPSMGDWAGRDHMIAAPYSPWQDPLQLHPMQTRKGSKKPMG